MYRVESDNPAALIITSLSDHGFVPSARMHGSLTPRTIAQPVSFVSFGGCRSVICCEHVAFDLQSRGVIVKTAVTKAVCEVNWPRLITVHRSPYVGYGVL